MNSHGHSSKDGLTLTLQKKAHDITQPLQSTISGITPAYNIAPAALSAAAAAEEQVVEDRFMPLHRLFFTFFSIGCRAFGGPVASITMISDEVVTKRRWVTPAKFKRIMAVYQIVPGPEATELCCHFGYLSRGPIGCVIAGLGFTLPGFVLMTLLAYIYVHYGVQNANFQASFQAIRPAVAAMIVRAVHKLGWTVISNVETNEIDVCLAAIAFFTAFSVVINMNFFLPLFLGGILYTLAHHRMYKCMAAVFVVFWCAYGIIMVYVGIPNSSAGTGVVRHVDALHLWLLGLLGGAMTFGGAYTAIPFMQTEATVLASWMTKQQFLDGIALGTCIPTPLVMFSAFVGFIGGKQLHLGYEDLSGEFLGAVVTAVGMFTPAFTFCLFGHHLLERLVNIQAIQVFLYGMTAAVAGLVATTAMQMTQTSCTSPLAAIIFLCVLFVLFHANHKLLNPAMVCSSALIGQFFFPPN